jgi:hypothetical protein
MSNVVTTKFVRKPMFVDAVQVTTENFFDVATWCQGVVRTADGVPTEWQTEGVPEDLTSLHIHVRVQSPKNEKQTQARVGDWILYMDRGGYKVYTDRAFQHSFDDAMAKPDDSQLQFSDEPNPTEVDVPTQADDAAMVAAEEVGLVIENPIEMTEQERIAQIKAEARQQ